MFTWRLTKWNTNIKMCLHPCAMFLIRPCRQVQQSRDSHKRIFCWVRRRQEILETKSSYEIRLNIRARVAAEIGEHYRQNFAGAVGTSGRNRLAARGSRIRSNSFIEKWTRKLFHNNRRNAAVELDVEFMMLARNAVHAFVQAFLLSRIFDVFWIISALGLRAKIAAGVDPFRGLAEPEGVEHREQVVFHCSSSHTASDQASAQLTESASEIEISHNTYRVVFRQGFCSFSVDSEAFGGFFRRSRISPEAFCQYKYSSTREVGFAKNSSNQNQSPALRQDLRIADDDLQKFFITDDLLADHFLSS